MLDIVLLLRVLFITVVIMHARKHGVIGSEDCNVPETKKRSITA